MSFKGGIAEAAKLLVGLDRQGRENVLAIIAEKSPHMAEILKKHMVTMDDLQYLTTKMLAELLREIKVSDLGLSLRIASEELKNHILTNVSKSLRSEIEEILLGPPQPVSKVNEAADRIMEVVLKKIDKGELVLKEGGEELV